MTEPQSGPFGDPGQPESSGRGGLDPSGERFARQDESFGGQDEGPAGQDERYQHPAGSGSTSTGSTSTGSTSTAGVSTTTRTSQQAVPQQYGRGTDRGPGYERGEGDYETGMRPDEGRGADMGVGSDIIAATAGRAWPAVLAGGLGLIALGIMLLVWPRESLNLVAILIGAAVIVSGVTRLVEGFSAHRESGGMRAGYVVIGLFAILAGVFLLRHHALSLFVVAFVTGVYFIAHGISDLGVAISGQAPARVLRGVLGLFGIAAGILMVVWPSITLVLLLTLVAAWLMFYGLVLSAIAFGLIRASRSGRERAHRGAPKGQLAHSAH
jgi:uncharacterized membrane protein HdeD (DUF308 family)